MNRTIFRYSTLSSIPFICLLFLCINNPSDNDDDTDNGRVIKGRFTDINNRPVSGAFVRILPINFVPSLSLPKKALLASDTTDGNGNYQIPVADSGVFNLEGSKDDLGVFVDSIVVPKDTNDITIPDNILKKVGVIKGISYMPGQNDTNQVRVTLYIPGTGRITKPVIGGTFSFLGVPEGKYQLIIDPTLNAYNVKIIDTTLIAGDTLNMDTVRLDLFEPDTIEILSTSIFGNLGPNKIYRLNQTSLIPAGQTLLIDSGTTIIFNGDFYITSTEKSKLIANGTAASPVVFKNPFVGTQSGNIAVDNHASFSYCIFDNMSTAIASLEFDTSTISNCVFRNCNYGLSNAGLSSVKVLNSVFINNKTSIMINEVDNPNYDIYQEINPPILINNIFYNNTNALYYFIVDSAVNKPMLNYNCFNENDSTIVYLLSYSDSSLASYKIPSDTSIIIDDPKFESISEGNDDYHLQLKSPCIGTGINSTDMGIYSTYKQ